MISATILEVFTLQRLLFLWNLSSTTAYLKCCEGTLGYPGYLIFLSIKNCHTWKHMVKKHRYLWFIYALHSLHGSLNCWQSQVCPRMPNQSSQGAGTSPVLVLLPWRQKEGGWSVMLEITELVSPEDSCPSPESYRQRSVISNTKSG